MQTNRVDVEHFKAFDAMMQSLYIYFGHTYKSDRVSVVYRHLSDCRIPADAFPSIGTLLQDTLDSTSGNIGKRIKEAWGEVGRTRRMPTAYQEAQPCDQCGGVGVFSARKDGYWFAFRCAGCANWSGKYGTGVPATYPLELRSQGYAEIEFYPSPFEDRVEVDFKQMRQIVSGVVQNVGDTASRHKEAERQRNIKRAREEEAA